jgi:uncharacterized protein YciI
VLGSPPERRSYHVVRYRWPVGHDAAVRSAYAEHRADLDGLGADGGLWLIGTLPEADGFVDAIAVFRSERAARAFSDRDPLFVRGIAEAGPVEGWDPLAYAG